MNSFNILDSTLRDGSYAINYQFTKKQYEEILPVLEEIGFDLIEVGHGQGLGASRKESSMAAESDETYLSITADKIKKSKWGMFCIPGIAKLEDVDLAAKYGMSFIRIGTNVEDYEKAKPFIEKAKNYGMYVCSNFMKSYTCSPEKFSEYAVEAYKMGTDLVYIVDSSGGMFSEDLEKYVNECKSKIQDIKLGFHGHNNLGLAVSNSIKAIELGVDLIDTTLFGIGRSSGNTPAEQLICAMIRKGIDLEIDMIKLMDLSEETIMPLLYNKQNSSIDYICGLAHFHSSYLPIIHKYSNKYRVDPRLLIIKVSKENKSEAPEELVEKLAKKLADEGVEGHWKPLYEHYHGGEQ